jgi:hypothetical protein
MIKTEVSNIAGTLGSSITQTAGNIRMEVNRTENYICTCKSSADNESKYIRLNEADYNKLSKSGIDSGLTLLITFDEGNIITAENKIYFKLCKDLKNSEEVKNSVIHDTGILLSPQKINAGETIPFMFNGTNWIMTSLSSAYIDVKADSIISEVRRTAGYAAYSSSSKNSKVYKVELRSDQELTADQFY